MVGKKTPIKVDAKKAILIVDGGYLDYTFEAYCNLKGWQKPPKNHLVLDYQRLTKSLSTRFEVEIKDSFFYHALPWTEEGSGEWQKTKSLELVEIQQQRLNRIKSRGISLREGKTQQVTRNCYHKELKETQATFTSQKRVDTMMVVDLLSTHHNDPEVNTYIVITGDDDLFPAFEYLHDSGEANVIVVVHQRHRAKPIASSGWWAEYFIWEDYVRFVETWAPDRSSINKMWDDLKERRKEKKKERSKARVEEKQLTGDA